MDHYHPCVRPTAPRARPALRRIFLVAFFLGVAMHARATVPIAAAAPFQIAPVERLLNPDGTLDLQTGYSGTLDLTGWEVILDSTRGPIISRASASAPGATRAKDVPPTLPTSPSSLDRSAFRHDGLNGGVSVLAVTGGDLFANGAFTQTADTAVTLNRIATYSAGAWSALAHNGLHPWVNALAVSGSDLYVGGTFTQTADGAVTDLSPIAKYTGGAWSPLAHNRLNNTLAALTVSTTDLFVGGYFTQTADAAVALDRIAQLSLATVP